VRGLILGGGVAVFAALAALAITEAPLGTPLFFALAAVPCIVYGLVLRRLLAGPTAPGAEEQAAAEAVQGPLPKLLVGALLLAAAFRLPPAVAPVGADNDMVRYMYDGRLQRLGINPFLVVPSDPEVAWTHTDLTRRMPSIRARTPYPAAAQLFFRLVVTIRETPRAMKLALVGCDLLTIWVLVTWLRQTRRSPWLALAYAWNPLVILEVAHSGHIDALGALWIAVAAWMLTTGRPMRGSIGFVIAIASKLLPIVLVPLLWKRIRLRDGIAAAAVFVLLYLPFRSAGAVPLGAVPNVVAFIRFNGPLFKGLLWLASPQVAAAIAVLAGLAVAAWMRFTRPADDPAAWAWPMAVSLSAAPVIYPWYLLYITPFLFTADTLPLVAWTYTALPVYVVWYLSKFGHRWFVPAPVQWIEFGTIAAVLTVQIIFSARRRSRSRSA
jgi:hypothetical protein